MGCFWEFFDFFEGVFTWDSPLDVKFFAHLANANTVSQGVLSFGWLAFTLFSVKAPFAPGTVVHS